MMDSKFIKNIAPICTLQSVKAGKKLHKRLPTMTQLEFYTFIEKMKSPRINRKKIKYVVDNFPYT